MKCPICGYDLWNLSEPRCPECGTSFDLRHFSFKPASVAFVCPHCGHRHAGQGQYHQPSENDRAMCRQCGKAMLVSSMSVVPLTDDALGVPIRLTPWEQYHASARPWRETWVERGFRPAFWLMLGFRRDRAWMSTCWRSMVNPTELAESTGPHSRAGRAIVFSAIAWLGAAGCHMLFTLAGLGLAALLLRAAGRLDAQVESWGWSAATIAAATSYAMAGWMICVVIGAAAAHLALRSTGGSNGGFGRTLLAVAYGQGPAVVGAIPVIGLPAAYIWTKISAIEQLRIVQGIPFWRAAAACLWLPVLAFPSAAVLLTVWATGVLG